MNSVTVWPDSSNTRCRVRSDMWCAAATVPWLRPASAMCALMYASICSRTASGRRGSSRSASAALSRSRHARPIRASEALAPAPLSARETAEATSGLSTDPGPSATRVGAEHGVDEVLRRHQRGARERDDRAAPFTLQADRVRPVDVVDGHPARREHHLPVALLDGCRAGPLDARLEQIRRQPPGPGWRAAQDLRAAGYMKRPDAAELSRAQPAFSTRRVPRQVWDEPVEVGGERVTPFV